MAGLSRDGKGGRKDEGGLWNIYPSHTQMSLFLLHYISRFYIRAK